MKQNNYDKMHYVHMSYTAQECTSCTTRASNYKVILITATDINRCSLLASVQMKLLQKHAAATRCYYNQVAYTLQNK